MPTHTARSFATHLLVLAGCALLISLTVAACQQQPAEPPAPPAPQYLPTATIKDLMLSVIDPSADAVWLSVTTVVDKGGLVDTQPRTDEEWATVRQGATTLMEAANLLLIPGRRTARPGEKSETPGVELEPEEMDELIAKDRPGWETRAKALHDAAYATLQAVEAKDANKVFELGEQIENACEGCHSTYWYPNEQIPVFPGETTP